MPKPPGEGSSIRDGSRRRRALRICICLLLSLLLHVVVFHRWGPGSEGVAPAAVVDLSRLPSTAQAAAQALPSPPASGLETNEDKYVLGVYNLFDASPSDKANAEEQARGLPDCEFRYSGRWIEVSRRLGELNILYGGANHPFVVVRFRNGGEPEFQAITEMGLRQYVELRGELFLDKQKDRKAEFSDCPQLREAFLRGQNMFFRSKSASEVAFVGFMTREHVHELKGRITHALEGQTGSYLRVTYGLGGTGVTYDIQRLR